MRVTAFLLTTALLVAGAASALAATQRFPVGDFQRVQSSVPYDVRVHVGGAPAVSVDGPQRVIDRLDIHTEGDRLIIRAKPDHWWSFNGPMHDKVLIDVVAPRLAGLGLSGPGNIDVDRVRAPDFQASLSGPGNIRIGQIEVGRAVFDLSGPGDFYLAGRVGRARMSVSGPGTVHGEKLGIQDLDVSLSGPGDINTTVFGIATGHLSGPGDIRLGGHPRCQISKSGPGDVRCG